MVHDRLHPSLLVVWHDLGYNADWCSRTVVIGLFSFTLYSPWMNLFICLMCLRGSRKSILWRRNVYFIKGWSVTPGQPLPTVVKWKKKKKKTSIWSVGVNHDLVRFFNTKIVFLSCFPELTKWWPPKYNKDVFFCIFQ